MTKKKILRNSSKIIQADHNKALKISSVPELKFPQKFSGNFPEMHQKPPTTSTPCQSLSILPKDPWACRKLNVGSNLRPIKFQLTLPLCHSGNTNGLIHDSYIFKTISLHLSQPPCQCQSQQWPPNSVFFFFFYVFSDLQIFFLQKQLYVKSSDIRDCWKFYHDKKVCCLLISLLITLCQPLMEAQDLHVCNGSRLCLQTSLDFSPLHYFPAAFFGISIPPTFSLCWEKLEICPSTVFSRH